MTPGTEKQRLADGESSSPLAPRLDLLLQHAISSEQFEADMVRACRDDPEEIWNLLALLDQYHRLEILPTEQFRTLKASAERYGLVRREPYIPNLPPKPRAPVAPPPPRASEPITAPSPPAPAAAAPSIADTGSPAAPIAPEPILAPAPAAEPAARVTEVPEVPAAQPAARTIQVGSVISGRLRLEAELDSDDRGRNFQALDQQHAGQPPAVCQVAVHCMEPGAANFETALAERRAEFQLAQPLSHPNVLSVRELDQDGVYIYLTANLMRGETLAALLERRSGRALARSAAFAIIRDIGAALTYTHDHGVVHGNLQPQAVLISPAGELRVRGFGAQRAASCYASCEQLEGRPADRRDDLYALACISYELLHGSHPFERQNASTARGRGMTPVRPIQLSGAQWRALRLGLAWRREGRNLSVARWIGRMHLGSASKRLPLLVDLMAMPPPRRSWWRPVLVLGCLAAAAAFALSTYRSTGMIDFSVEWNRLRTALTARVHPAAPLSAVLAPSAPPATALPLPASEPAAQEAAPSTPEAKVFAAPEAQAPQPAPAAEPVAPTPKPLPSAVADAPQPAQFAAPVAPSPSPTESLAPPPHPTPPASTLASSSAARTKPTPEAKPSIPSPSAAKGADAPAPATGARIELTSDHYAVQASDSAAHILVRRTGSTRGEARFVWWTENASASADQDFVSWGRRTQRIGAGQSTVTLLVPIIKDPARSAPRKFYVLIGAQDDSAKLGAITRATVQLHAPT